MKNVFRKWPFSHPKHEQNGPGKKLWLDIYVEKGVWAKKSAQLVIPVRSTFQNDSHPPIGGPHPVLYFTNQIKKKYCTAMCYNTPLYSGTARYSATTKQQLQMDKPCPAPEQHSVKGLFGQSSTRSEGDGWSWMGLLLTKRESSPPFITLPLLHPFCSPKGWMLQCEKPCVCLVSLEYVIRCDKPPQAHNVVSKCK